MIVVFLHEQRKLCTTNKKTGEDTLYHVMCINIDGPFLDNFDTEKFVSDWIESPVTLRHLIGHNSCRTETREKANENVILL